MKLSKRIEAIENAVETKKQEVIDNIQSTKQDIILKGQSGWIMLTLDVVAEELFGEFGYATLNPEQQQQVWIEILGNKEQYGVIFE